MGEETLSDLSIFFQAFGRLKSRLLTVLALVTPSQSRKSLPVPFQSLCLLPQAGGNNGTSIIIKLGREKYKILTSPLPSIRNRTVTLKIDIPM